MPTPYWVQIELQPQGKCTMYTQLDFTKIDRVVVMRDSGEPTKVLIHYCKQDIGIDGMGCESFLRYWNEYSSMERKDEEAKPGIIELPSASQILGGLN